MPDTVEHLIKEFEYQELVQIAERIGLSVVSRWKPRKLVRYILTKVQDDMPELPSEKNMKPVDLLVEDFLYVAGFIDSDGSKEEEAEEKGGDVNDPDSVELFMKEHDVKSKPPCYSKADDEDPSCKRCILFRFCATERLAQLPPCFGNLYDKNDAECRACIEAPFCKNAVYSK